MQRNAGDAAPAGRVKFSVIVTGAPRCRSYCLGPNTVNVGSGTVSSDTLIAAVAGPVSIATMVSDAVTITGTSRVAPAASAAMSMAVMTTAPFRLSVPPVIRAAPAGPFVTRSRYPPFVGVATVNCSTNVPLVAAPRDSVFGPNTTMVSVANTATDRSSLRPATARTNRLNQLGPPRASLSPVMLRTATPATSTARSIAARRDTR